MIQGKDLCHLSEHEKNVTHDAWRMKGLPQRSFQDRTDKGMRETLGTALSFGSESFSFHPCVGPGWCGETDDGRVTPPRRAGAPAGDLLLVFLWSCWQGNSEQFSSVRRSMPPSVG